jgi:hypothetical protein
MLFNLDTHLLRKTRPEPVLAFTYAGSLAFCAWTMRDIDSATGRKFCTSVVSTLGIVPYTIVVMTKTRERLVELAMKAEYEELTAPKRNEDEELLRWWIVLNGVRSVFPLVSAVLATVALLA